METHDFIYNNKEYTLVDVYDTNSGKIIQLNSDDDIILFFIDKESKARRLTSQEELDFRKKYHLIDPGYVTATFRDVVNFELTAKKMDPKREASFKKHFREKLYGLGAGLSDSKYINDRLKIMKYRLGAKENAYLSNTVYLTSDPNERISEWIITHETIHGIVNKSRITTMGVMEGVTDMMVGKMIPYGNYSSNHSIIEGEELQINDPGFGQAYLVAFAKQLVFALGSDFNFYEMLTEPHKQISKFAEKYGASKCRILMHKINKLYHDYNINNFKEAQKYMLEIVFDKKIEEITNEEEAKNYFNELINFGLLRGRINGKDDDLENYYHQKQALLNEKNIDSKRIPDYYEKPFYPCGDCYFRYNSYLESSIKARKEGKGKDFKILYNKDNTCVYIVIDGKLNFIHNASFNNKRLFLSDKINKENSIIEPLSNGNYLITGPDGITEEVRDTHSEKIINEYFDELSDEDDNSRSI